MLLSFISYIFWFMEWRYQFLFKDESRERKTTVAAAGFWRGGQEQPAEMRGVHDDRRAHT